MNPIIHELLEFLTFREKTAKLLDSLREQIHKISDAIEDQTKATREAYAPRQNSKSSEPTIVKVVEAVVTRKESSDKQEESKYQTRSLFWQKATFVAVFGYAIVAACQWLAYLQSNRINREALESVQRAFLTPGGTRYKQLIKPLPTGDQNTWKFSEEIVNTGTTPAIECMHVFAVEELPSGLTERKVGFKDDEAALAHARNSVSTIGPKAPLYLGPLILKRLPKMTHLCSQDLTQPKKAFA